MPRESVRSTKAATKTRKVPVRKAVAKKAPARKTTTRKNPVRKVVVNKKAPAKRVAKRPARHAGSALMAKPTRKAPSRVKQPRGPINKWLIIVPAVVLISVAGASALIGMADAGAINVTSVITETNAEREQRNRERIAAGEAPVEEIAAVPKSDVPAARKRDGGLSGLGKGSGAPTPPPVETASSTEDTASSSDNIIPGEVVEVETAVDVTSVEEAEAEEAESSEERGEETPEESQVAEEETPIEAVNEESSESASGT